MHTKTIAAALLAVSLLAPQLHAISAKEAATTEVKKLVQDMKPFKGVKAAQRVAIPTYRVLFVTRNKVTARAEDWLGGVGGGSSSGAKASMEVMLGNMDYAALQAIVDAAYADFVAQIKATGVEVVPFETVKASAAYQTLKINGGNAAKPYTKVLPGGQTHVVILSPTEIPLWFTNWDGGITDQGMSQANIKALGNLSKELNAALLYPTMMVDFAALSGSGGKFARRAEVGAQKAVFIHPVGTLFWTQDHRGAAFSRITDGIGAEGDPGAFISGGESNNSGLVKGLQDIGIDIGPAKSKKNLVLEANPAEFSKMALEALGAVNDLYKRALVEAKK
ncbi:MAG TPA: hypothetical protein VGF48_06240 [Thermoanaerobaculia bacterium]|jgi:hypothetical protein